MLNKVQLIGRLGREPEVRYTTEGKCVANLAIATSESPLCQDRCRLLQGDFVSL